MENGVQLALLRHLLFISVSIWSCIPPDIRMSYAAEVPLYRARH